MNLTANIECPYTLQQEMLHTFIHGLGIWFGLINIPFLLYESVKNDSCNLAAAGIYSFSFFITFLISTLFHSTTDNQLKYIFKLMDYASIYIFIAGSYTPFMLNFGNNSTGKFLLILVWMLCLIGVVFKLLLHDRFQICAVCFYALIALIFLFDCKAFLMAMPCKVLIFFISGMFLYATGLVFYVIRKWKYHHAAWHLFSLAAAICHFEAIRIMTNK